MSAPESKTCSKCGKTKPLGEFDKRTRRGRTCRSCKAAPCSFPGCNNPPKSLGLCAAHYMQQREGHELRPLKHHNLGKTCLFDGCGKPARARGLCTGHSIQARKGPDLVPLTRPPSGIRLCRNTNGYVEARVYPDHPLYGFANPNYGHRVQRRDLYHRLVVAAFLGRRLPATETVHHKDGDRANNALDNLQVRHGSHGQGQKVICADCGSHNTMSTDL